MKATVHLSLLIFLLVTTSATAATDLQTNNQKYSYAMGMRIGQMLRGQVNSEIDIPALTAAIADVLSGNLSPEQLQEAMNTHLQEESAKRAKIGADNSEKGQTFREANALKDGVVTLDSGLQYKVIKAGEGTTPSKDQKVEVHYRGHLIDGKEFDSSYKRGKPAQFSLNGVVAGFSEAITRMKPGAKWEVVMPPELAYGKKGAGTDIGPNETLIFEIEYLKAVN
ncbi:MAG: FKBP-type peptidyl-prolyl cis-trans isomerase [Candidatus Thiodiazotropha sp. (ex Ustalcina ferruginea)]|nr:FKBP-type peptidyl-prolyl cis-trans isomerase [Candidatus Thiodiazotropha sp. (ex Ustalcina ferruginea)]